MSNLDDVTNTVSDIPTVSNQPDESEDVVIGGQLEIPLERQDLPIYANTTLCSLDKSGNRHVWVDNFSLQDIADRRFGLQTNDNVVFKVDMSTSQMGEPAANDANLRAQLQLRPYQAELARDPCRGLNTVITAPTGSGKTFIAAEVILQHLLDKARSRIANNNMLATVDTHKHVFFVVPTTDLLDQQATALSTFMSPTSFNVKTMFSETNMHKLLANADVIVCTPAILTCVTVYHLEARRLSMENISMLVLDECHNTRGEAPYKLLMEYVRRYYYDNGVHFTFGWSSGHQQPQVLAMTASFGTGKSNDIEQVKLHMVKTCAMLLCSRICDVRDNLDTLEKHVVVPDHDKYCLVDDTQSLQLYKSLIHIMEKSTEVVVYILSQHSEKFTEATESGRAANLPMTVKYDYSKPQRHGQWYSLMISAVLPVMTFNPEEKSAVVDALCAIKISAEHIDVLRHTESSTTCDSLKRVLAHHSSLFVGQSSLRNNIRELFNDAIAEDPVSASNALLDKLCSVLGEHLPHSTTDSRVIVFVSTRYIAQALERVVNLRLPHMNARAFIGSNSPDSNNSTNRETLAAFTCGECLVLFATTVAEEGLDISQCDLVVNYNHLTDDTLTCNAKVTVTSTVYHFCRSWSSGEQSRVVTLCLSSTTNTKAVLNEAREELSQRALDVIHQHPDEFERDVTAEIVTQYNESTSAIEPVIVKPAIPEDGYDSVFWLQLSPTSFRLVDSTGRILQPSKKWKEVLHYIDIETYDTFKHPTIRGAMNARQCGPIAQQREAHRARAKEEREVNLTEQAKELGLDSAKHQLPISHSNVKRDDLFTRDNV